MALGNNIATRGLSVEDEQLATRGFLQPKVSAAVSTTIRKRRVKKRVIELEIPVFGTKIIDSILILTLEGIKLININIDIRLLYGIQVEQFLDAKVTILKDITLNAILSGRRASEFNLGFNIFGTRINPVDSILDINTIITIDRSYALNIVGNTLKNVIISRHFSGTKISPSISESLIKGEIIRELKFGIEVEVKKAKRSKINEMLDILKATINS